MTGGRRLGLNSRPGQQMAVWGSVDVRKSSGGDLCVNPIYRNRSPQ